MSNRIKILLLAADPRNVKYRPLWTQEVNHIKNAIELATHRDHFKVKAVFGVKLKDLLTILMRYKPDIVHFSGHGNKNSELLFENDFGNTDTINAVALANLLKKLNDNIRLVVLNACYTKSIVEAFKDAIDFTIGMNDLVYDQSAIAFAGAFYSALAFDYSVEKAFDLALSQIEVLKLPGPNTPELFTRPGADTLDHLIKLNSHSTSDSPALKPVEKITVEHSSSCLWIHGWVMRVYDILPTVELNWTKYFDRDSRRVPSQRVWERSLRPSLQEAKPKLNKHGRFIDVRGRLPLTTMLGVGSLFPKVDDYRLRTEQPTLGKTHLWRSDAKPSKSRFRIIEEKQKRTGTGAKDILVALSITGNAIREVASLFKQSSEMSAMILAEPDSGTGEGALRSARDAVALAINAKELIRDLRIKYKASRTHLVLYTPASFSLFLGQYLSALGDIITYERDLDGNYKQSITLRTG
jgi:hypothetical protein